MTTPTQTSKPIPTPHPLAQLPLFVYGTLKPGNRNNARLCVHATPDAFLPGTVQGFTLHDLGPFPAMLPSDDEGARVQGLLVTYPVLTNGIYRAVLGDVDRLEGYREGSNSNLYNRILTWVDLGNGREPQLAWTYTFAQPLDVTEFPALSDGLWDRNRVRN